MLLLHETKGQPNEKDDTHIVAAFGRGMCPKLVGEVKSAKRAVRVNVANALAVLCDELKNPIHVVGCVEAGVVEVLNEQTKSDPDPLTRRRASKALAICARDANGRGAMVAASTARAVFEALEDEEDEVRENVYEALIRLSTGEKRGVRALIEAKYPATLVGAAANEVVALQPRALHLLRNCLGDYVGLHEALAHSAVETSIVLLASTAAAVRADAAETLSTLCFAEMAKMAAIAAGAVPVLVHLLKDPDQPVRASAAGALMAISTTDDGKREMVVVVVPPPPKKRTVSSADGAEGKDADDGDARPAQQQKSDDDHDDNDASIEAVHLLINLLREDSVPLRANALKCIANLAVHPRARDQFHKSTAAVALIDGLCNSKVDLLAKHAYIAKRSVMWRP